MERRVQFFVLLAALSSVGASSALAGGGANHVAVREQPPYYVGKQPSPSGAVGYLSVRLGRSFAEVGSAADWTSVTTEFLRRCDLYLDSLGIRRVLADTAARAKPEMPDLYVGDPEGFYAPTGVLSDEERARHGRTAVLIYGRDPSGKQKQIAESLAVAAGVEFILFVSLELSDYPVTQKNLKGSKIVDLGTGYRLAIPWLTSLDQPVEVLQFAGALYRADGKFVRAGAEAFYALRTPFGESAFGVQRTLERTDVSEILERRRSDIPGEPLAWQIALNNLVAQLTGWKDRIITGTR